MSNKQPIMERRMTAISYLENLKNEFFDSYKRMLEIDETIYPSSLRETMEEFELMLNESIENAKKD